MTWCLRVLILAIGSLAFLVSGVLGAPAATRKGELSPKYKKWLEEEVVYIITEEEHKAFLKLTEDAARDQFINDFWAIRNPNRNSSTNSFKDEHYRRIQYANEHFGRQSNTEGWRTDMGRAYILFGKPVSQARFIAGGQLYPCELWFYSNTAGDPALPSFFYLLFYIPGDIGEYRFYRPYLDGPMQLVRGSQFNSNKDVYNYLSEFGGDLARAAFSLIPSDPMDTQTYEPLMTSDMLVSRIQNLANGSYNVSRVHEMRALHESVRSFFLVADQRPLDIVSVAVTDPSGQSWLDYSISIDAAELGVPDAADPENFQLTFAYQLKSDAGDVIIEDLVKRKYKAFVAADGQKLFKPFQIAGRIPITPGKYRLEVEVHQQLSGKSFRGFQNIVVGERNTLSLSGPLLVSSVEQVSHPDGATPFQYFGAQFHPAVRRQVTPESSLRVLFQLSVPGPVADYELEYVLAHTQLRDARRTVTETVHASQFRNGELLSSKGLSLSGLPEGDYRLILNARRADSPDVVLVSSNTGFHVVPAPAEATLYFDPNTPKLAQPGMAAYIRALAALSQKNQDATAAYLRQAVDQNPGNLFADARLVDLYFHGRKFVEIAHLYDKLGMAPFEGSAESLTQISLSLWNEGDQRRAREVLQSAQSSFPGNPLVAALARTVR